MVLIIPRHNQFSYIHRKQRVDIDNY